MRNIIVQAYPHGYAVSKAPPIATCTTRSATLARATEKLWKEEGFDVVLVLQPRV